MTLITEKMCETCKKVLPIKNFEKRPGTKAAYSEDCRNCDRANKQRDRMADLEARTLEKFLEVANTGGSHVPHTAELLESILSNFGGTNGFAAMATKQFYDSKPGSRLRNQMLEMIVRLASKNTEQGGARKPTSMLTEEELEAEIEKRIRNAALLSQAGRLIDAEPITENHLGLPDGRVEEPDGGTLGEEVGSPEAVPADSPAGRVPPINIV